MRDPGRPFSGFGIKRTTTSPSSTPSASTTITITTSTTTKTSNTKKPTTTFHLAAGLASGFTSSILLQPADLLKTRVQQSGSSSLWQTLRFIASTPHPVRQLWRGTLPSTIRTSFGSALYFTALNGLRTSLAKNAPSLSPVTGNIVESSGRQDRSTASSSTLPKLSPVADLTCGAFARASVGFIMMPITVIKVRYESNYYNYNSLLGAVRDIASKEGIRGFFSGFGATAIRDAPYAGLYVLFYERGKKVLSRLVGRLNSDLKTSPDGSTSPTSTMKTSQSTSVNFLSASAAASLATLLTNPPDAVKTRLQLYPQKYKNMVQALKLMLKDDGVRSLFDGLGLRMARKALSSALAWTVYEEVIRRAELRFVGNDG